MNSEFEKYAKDQFDHYEVPVDTESLWAEIAPIVKPKKDNRRIIWFFLGGLLIGSLGIASLYQGLQNPSAEVMTIRELNSEKDQGSILSNEQQRANDPLPTLGESTSIVKKGDTKKPVKEIKQANINSSQPNELADNLQKSNSIKESSVAEKVSKIDQSNTLITNQNNAVLLNASNNGNHLAKGRQSNAEQLLAEDDQMRNNFKNENQERAWSRALVPFFVFAEPLVSDKRFASEMEVLDAFKKRLEKNRLEELSSDKKVGLTKKRRGSFLNDIQFGLGIYGGVSRSTSELEPRNTQSSDYELLRINSEKQLETLHAGLSALLVSNEKLYLRTGLEYTRIGSLFSQNAERVEVDSVEGIVEIQINEFTGDTTEILGYLQRTRTTRYIKKSYNYFHLVDVPLILGYNFGSEDVTIGIEAGIYANILVKNKGEVFQQDESFYDKKEDPQGWYKSNLGISPFIGCNVTYHFNENLQIHLSPGFRFPSVYSTSANPLREEHANLGVQAGVRYIFDNY
jgi:hypothetical protein